MINRKELIKEYYKSGEVAKMLGVSTRTIQNYCIKKDLNEVIINNRRLIPRDSLIEYLSKKGIIGNEVDTRHDIIYARVSTHKQKNRGDLQRQIESVQLYVVHQNPSNLCIIQDVGSGLNDNRKGLVKVIDLVQQGKVRRIFVSYKDRLTRFGFNYIKMICDYNGTEIIIVNRECDDKTVSEELAEDIISIIHSFSGKLYGMRRKVIETVGKELDKNDTC